MFFSTIKGKISAVFSCLVLIIIGVAVSSYWSVDKIQSLFDEYRDEDAVAFTMAGIKHQANTLHNTLLLYQATGEERHQREVFDLMTGLQRDINQVIESLEGERKANAKQISVQLLAYEQLFSQMALVQLEYGESITRAGYHFNRFFLAATSSLQRFNHNHSLDALIRQQQLLIMLHTQVVGLRLLVTSQNTLTSRISEQVDDWQLSSNVPAWQLIANDYMSEYDKLVSFQNSYRLLKKKLQQMTSELMTLVAEANQQTFAAMNYWQSQINQSVSWINTTVKWLVWLGILTGIMLALWMANSIAKPLEAIKRALVRLAEGQAEEKIPYLSRSDEIGDMAKAADVFKQANQKTQMLLNKTSILVTEQQNANAKLQQEIKERQRVEKALVKARQAAERASQYKSLFLANMSHEVRTPLGGVVGMLSLLQESELVEEQRGYVDSAMKSSEALLSILNDILDYSKIEAGKLTLQLAPFNLRHLVEDVVFLSAFRAAQKNINLQYVIAKHLPLHLVGDVGRIRQILTNFVTNAIKFTDKGHVLITVSGHCEFDEVILELNVEDTGCGIPQEQLDIIFAEYQQADQVGRGGTGLGLAITKKLIEIMWGQVKVSSEVGKGSCFSATLPLTICHEPLPVMKLSHAMAKGLMIDPDPINGKAVSLLVEALGAELLYVQQPTDVADVLRQCSEQVSFVLLNALWIEQTQSLISYLQSLPLLAKAPIIVLGPLGSLQAVDKYQANHCAGYLAYPIKLEELCRTLRQTSTKRFKLIERGKAVEESKASKAFEKLVNKQQLCVLLVEDNPVNQKVAAKMLEKLGCAVAVANNGQEGVTQWQQQSFDLVVMDCNMPVMDGYQATRRIRNLEQERTDSLHTTIIALTANAMKGERENCLSAGMDDYLTKPVKLVDLKRVVDQVAKEVVFSE
ncbi:hybrid sensor histidine kinase/response regulator [Spartinivicinus poritis]|uniref:histidine kinase n=1 Tax=Spartinivicinus poritis TaxID=2994640 RepID=A0ABT5U2G4_9GAMM|nr:hybrid sensor histidine kinase/response regulator [Spartinivicinus sp. A2-2]MDE1460553.1 response regulator [Spartinivicinus sp. A2-2]